MQEARQMLIILMQFIIPIVMVMYARLFHVSITFAGLTQVKYQIQLQLLLASYPVCLHHQSPADGHKRDGINQVSVVKKTQFPLRVCCQFASVIGYEGITSVFHFFYFEQL